MSGRRDDDAQDEGHRGEHHARFASHAIDDDPKTDHADDLSDEEAVGDPRLQSGIEDGRRVDCRSATTYGLQLTLGEEEIDVADDACVVAVGHESLT